jgi:hypothetical protein
MCAGSPQLGVLRRLRPTPSSAGVGPIHHPPGLEQAMEGSGWFPRSLLLGSTGEAPGSTPAASPRLRRRPSPWPPGPKSNAEPGVSRPTAQRVCTANQPTSTGLELALPEEA